MANNFAVSGIGNFRGYDQGGNMVQVIAPVCINQLTAAVDCNASTNGASLEIFGCRNVVIEVRADTGTNATHIIKVQMSLDGTNWTDSSMIVSQLGIAEGVISALYCRFSVTTAEGGASTADVQIQAKP